MTSYNEMLLEVEHLLDRALIKQRKYLDALNEILTLINEHEYPNIDTIHSIAYKTVTNNKETK